MSIAWPLNWHADHLHAERDLNIVLSIVYAKSFVDDAEAISVLIESRFGRARADTFVRDLDHFCGLVALNPRLGRVNHGYATILHGIVHGLNWIFFQFDDSEIRFIHIVDGRRDKPHVEFL